MSSLCERTPATDYLLDAVSAKGPPWASSEYIRSGLGMHPEWSDHAVADICGLPGDRGQARRTLAARSSAGYGNLNSHKPKRLGTDGKAHAAARRSKDERGRQEGS